MMSSLLKQNLDALIESDAALTLRLNESLEPCPFEQQEGAFNSDPNLLFLEGLESVLCAANWVGERTGRTLILFDENWDKWLFALSQDWFAPLLERRDIHFCASKEALCQKAWEFVFEPCQIQGSETLHALLNGVHLSASDFRSYKLEAILNVCQNLKREEGWIDGRSLFDRYGGCPALICGAGSSLEAHLGMIAEFQKKGIVIGCGSALRVLNDRNIRPDFGAVIDPDPELERFPQDLDVPLLFQPQVASHLMERSNGLKIYMGSSSNFPLEMRLLEEGGVPAFQFDAGWDAATFALSSALAMGCNPIFLIGVDHGDGGYAFGLQEKRPRGSRRDFAEARRWIEDVCVANPDREIVHGMARMDFAPFNKPSLPDPTIETSSVHALLKNWLEEAESAFREPNQILVEAALFSTTLYDELLQPLWERWRYLFQREPGDLSLHKLLFFKRVIHSYVHAFSD